jgi:HlyD family secretion protein
VSTTQTDAVVRSTHARLGPGCSVRADTVVAAPEPKDGVIVADRSRSDWARPAATTRNARRLRVRRAAIILVVVAAGVGAYAGISRLGRSTRAQDIQLFKVTRRSFPVVLQEKGELKAENTNDIRCELEGKATILWLIDEGTTVRKGDKLVELASDEIDEKIRDAEIKVATSHAEYEAASKGLQILVDKNASEIRKAGVKLWLAEQALKKYKEGESVKSHQDAELALEKAVSLLQQARDKRVDSEELFKKEYITKYDLEQDRLAEASAEIELKTAKLALKILDEFTIPMDLAQKQSDVDEAGKELDRTKNEAQASEAKDRALVAAKESELKLNRDKLTKLQDQKKKTIILAPADGLVVYSQEYEWESENKLKTGVTVRERQKLIELPDTSVMKVKVRVHESKAEWLKLGLPATVEIEGVSGQRFTGRVSKIAALADNEDWLNRSVKEYRTEILLDGRFTKLKPNTSATVDILVTQLTNVLAVPVQSVFSKGEQHYVFVDDRSDVRPVEVQVGLSSIEYVEIKGGLREGQMVRLAPSDELRLKLPDGGGKDKKVATTRPATRPALSGQTTQPASQPASQPSTQPTVAGVRSPSAATQPVGTASSRPVLSANSGGEAVATRPAVGVRRSG